MHRVRFDHNSVLHAAIVAEQDSLQVVVVVPVEKMQKK